MLLKNNLVLLFRNLKNFIKNWQPISVPNVDMILISKVLASRLKSVISTIVNKNQVAYVNNRLIIGL